MSRRPSRSLTHSSLAVAAVLVAALATACAGLGDDPKSEAIPRVGLMHVGLDHIPPSLTGLTTQLEEEYGWDLPDLEIASCIDEKQASCRFTGKNVELLWRNLDGSTVDTQAEVFVGQGVDVIVAFEDQSIDAAKKATVESQTPIVFLHPSDPLADKLTNSLSRPGENLTGVFGPRDVVAKQLEVYQALVPRLHRVLTLVDPEDPRTERVLKEYKDAAAQLQRPLELDIREATTAQDLRRIFRSLRPGEVDSAFLLSNNLRQNYSALTIELAKRAQLPVQGSRKEWVEQGALFSYGVDLTPLGRAGARYVDSLLRGVSPEDLPVQRIPKIEFAINLKTAARLGIKVPQEMIIRADEVYRGGT
jgi:putative ABC transport system substrate-binding protein